MIIIILNSLLGVSAFLALVGLAGVIRHARWQANIKNAEATTIERPPTSPTPQSPDLKSGRLLKWVPRLGGLIRTPGVGRSSETIVTSHYRAELRDDTPYTILDIDTSNVLRAWFANPWAELKFSDAFQANARLQQEQKREAEAVRAVEDAEQQMIALLARTDPSEQQSIPFPIGAAIVACLLILEILPLNWAALAFGLSAVSTWIVTAILVTASAGAMVGLRLTRKNPRPRAILWAVIAAAYVALVLLRAEFLITVATVLALAATLQAVLLNAVWVGLSVCGAIVMSRTRSLRLNQAIGDARRARRHLAAQRAARERANQDVQREWAVLQEMLRIWTLNSAIPPTVSQADRIDELERALFALFPRQ